MKRIILILTALVAFGATVNAQTYTKVDNNTFQATKTVRAKTSNYQPTGKYYVDTDSIRYEIHIHTVTKGKNAGQTFCYIQKVSKKTGKPYWKQIDVKPEELGN